MDAWGSYSKTGIGLFFSIFDKFNFLNFLNISILAACICLVYSLFKNKTELIVPMKIVILLMHVILFMWIAFIGEKSSIKFVGFGLWISLILSIALFFDKKIDEIVCKNIPSQEK